MISLKLTVLSIDVLFLPEKPEHLWLFELIILKYVQIHR